MLKSNSFKWPLGLGLIFILGIMTPISCRNESSSGVSNTLPAQMSTSADWIKAKQFEIRARGSVLESYKRIYLILNNKPTGNGLGLVANNFNAPGRLSRDQLLDLEAKNLQNRGIEIQNSTALMNADGSYRRTMADIAEQYAEMSNLGWDHYIKNEQGFAQTSRMHIDNDGARISNFGKVIENRGKQLDNVLKELEIVLRNYYTIGYRNYTKSYIRYTKEIQKIWQQIGRANGQIGGAIVELKRYRRKATECESRRERILSQTYRSGNIELKNKKLRVSSIAKGFNYLASTEEGEACLHKALYSANFRDTKELYKIEYEVVFNSKKTQIMCPVAETDMEVDDLDEMDYPMPRLNKDTFDVEGYYQPLTYYQLYRLLTDADAQVKISNAPANEAGIGCNRLVPGTRKYYSTSKELEKAFAETYEVSIDAFPAANHGYAQDYSGIPTTNTSYRTMLDRVTGLFRKATSCLENVKQTAVAAAAAPATPAPVAAPLVAGQPAQTDMNVFHNPDFPLMSAGVRECFKLAEHHRYRAFTQLEAADAILEVLKKAATIPPPRSPHPVQLEPGAANTRNGNTFN